MKVGDFARTPLVPFLQLERIMDDAVACSIIPVTIPMYTLALIRRRKVNWLHNSSILFIGTKFIVEKKSYFNYSAKITLGDNTFLNSYMNFKLHLWC